MPNEKLAISPGIFASGALLPLLISIYKIYVDSKISKVAVYEIIENTYKDVIILYCKKMKKNIFKLTEKDFINIKILFEEKFEVNLHTSLIKEKESMIDKASKTAVNTTSVLSATCVTIALGFATIMPLTTLYIILITITIALISYPLLVLTTSTITKKSIDKFMNKEIKKELQQSYKIKIQKIKNITKKIKKTIITKTQEPVVVDKLIARFLSETPTAEELNGDLNQITKTECNIIKKNQSQKKINKLKEKPELLEKIYNPNIKISKKQRQKTIK